jgi:N-acetylmuramoyl-L-alanine amidase
MILALLAAVQLVAAAPGVSPSHDSLTVRDASRSRSVPLVATAAGPILRADRLKPVVPITVSHLVGDRWMVIVNGTAIELQQAVRLAKVGERHFQLAAAPEVRGGALYVPLQLVVEIIPLVAGNLVWDPDRFELRAFSSVTRAREAVAARPPAEPPAVDPPAPVRTAASTPARTATASRRPSRTLVVVDAGHGGQDPGMHGPLGGGPQVLEKNITLNVSKRVGAALVARGVDVKYTRTTDTLIALDDRGRIANDAHADLFVSIHVNAANPSWKNPGGARGFETYFLSEAKTEDARRVEQMENEVVKFETKSSAQAGDPLSFILNDMAQNEHLRESNELAQMIQRRLGAVHPGPSRGVKQAGFVVLVKAFMPAVLVEIGFGSNPGDAAFITNRAHVDEISAAIADAVVEYLKQYDRRVTASTASANADGLPPR